MPDRRTDYDGGYQPERASRPTIKAAAERPEPAGVNLLRGHTRATNVLRDRYENWVHDCWAAGQLNDDEHDARVAAVRAGVVDADLQMLLADLPPLPATKKQQKDADAEAKKVKKNEAGLRAKVKKMWGNCTFRLCCHVTIIAGFLALAITPAAVLTGQKHPPAGTNGIIAVTTVFGALGAMLAIVLMCVWLDGVDWQSGDAGKNRY
jgi:hypothetical protein